MRPIKPKETRSTRWAAITTIALALIIAFLLLSSGPPGASMISDKLAHVLAFTALAVPLSSVRARFAPFVFLSVCAYGGGIELIQPFVGRTGDWADFGMDVFGAGIGAAVGAAIARKRKRRNVL